MKPKPVRPVSPPATGRPAGPQGWWFALLLVVATILAYQPVWNAGFIWDDDSFLTKHELMRDAQALPKVWFSAATTDYFPMTFTSLWLEWRVWGLHAAGYHWTNLLLHAASVVILWRLLARLKIPGAWLAAALFALHPVNVESVAWITERKNTLAMFFYLAAMLAYVKFEDTQRQRCYWLAVGAFTLALLSKTAVVPLPFVLLAAAWWRRGRVDRRDILRSLPFFAIALVLGLVTIWFQNQHAISHDVIREKSFWPRLAGAGWAVWFYLYKALVPLNLSFVYPKWDINAANLLSYVPGVLVMVGLWLCWHYRRIWGRGSLFALLYFILLLLPILGFLDIFFMRYSLVSDHWQYFAIIGPLTLVAVWLGRVQGKARPIIYGSVLLILGSLTWQQCKMYHDVETLWRTTLKDNPNAFLAQLNFGGLLFERGDVDEAIPHLQKAAEIDPKAIEPVCALGNVSLRKGQVDQALAYFQKALEIAPTFWEANYGYGTCLYLKNRAADSIPYFRRALKGQPTDAMAANNLGLVLLQLERTDEALEVLEPALTAHPDDERLHDNVGIALFQKGRILEAVAHFQKALELQPEFSAARRDVAQAAWLMATSTDASTRNGAKAVELAERLNRVTEGRNPMFLRTLSAAYAEVGRFPEAVAIAQHAKEIATTQSIPTLAEELIKEIELYRSHKPLRVETKKSFPQ